MGPDPPCGSVTPTAFSAVLTTLLRAFLSELLEFSYIQRDTTGQHILYGAPVEGGEDGSVEMSPVQPLQKMGLLLQRGGVQGAGQVVSYKKPQELRVLYGLHSSSVDIDWGNSAEDSDGLECKTL